MVLEHFDQPLRHVEVGETPCDRFPSCSSQLRGLKRVRDEGPEALVERVLLAGIIEEPAACGMDELGVLSPVGFWDPFGYATSPEKFRR